jgi:hypothetical protein
LAKVAVARRETAVEPGVVNGDERSVSTLAPCTGKPKNNKIPDLKGQNKKMNTKPTETPGTLVQARARKKEKTTAAEEPCKTLLCANCSVASRKPLSCSLHA